MGNLRVVGLHPNLYKPLRHNTKEADFGKYALNYESDRLRAIRPHVLMME